jgi:hypothetical protein
MKKNRIDLNVIDEKLVITISEELRNRIPRPGDKIHVIQSYPANDDDEDDEGNVRDEAILAYSYGEKMVMSSVLSEDMETVLVNGDYKFKLNEDMTLKQGKLLVFTKESDAREKFKSLMNASIAETKRLQKAVKKQVEDLENTLNYLTEQLEKDHH